MAANLYKVLGKKTNIENKEAKEDNVNFLNKSIDKPDKESINSEEELVRIDKGFSIDKFLVGAEKAFKIIVSSYKENKIESAEKLLSPKVLKAFQEQIKNNANIYNFKIIDIKASVVNIDLVKKLAKIKVRFLSTQKNILEKKEEIIDVVDIWTFEKIIGSKDPTWILAEVNSE